MPAIVPAIASLTPGYRARSRSRVNRNGVIVYTSSRRQLQGWPQKIKDIARKLVEGNPLTEAERGYLHFWRKKEGIPTPRSGVSLSVFRDRTHLRGHIFTE